MDRDNAESMTDRALLVHNVVEVGILMERTEGLPALKERVAKVENDLGWLKKAFWGWAIPGTMALVGVLVKLIR